MSLRGSRASAEFRVGDEVPPPGFRPEPLEIPAPLTLEESGLPQGLVDELLLKGMYYVDRSTAQDLAQDLGLPYGVLAVALQKLKAERLCEVVSTRGFGEQLYEYSLTDDGRERVRELTARRPYYGPAPVPLHQYLRIAREQLRERPIIDRYALGQGLEHLVVNEPTIRVLGPAVNSGEPILFYGPPGNGKTSLAVALGKVLGRQDPIWVPHVVLTRDQLIKVFDPIVHEPAEAGEAGGLETGGPNEAQDHDRRWVLVQRPLVIGGGELTMAQFELAFDPITGVYFAPYQWKANGGTLLIDDLGRQPMRPQDLLNRWIIPLEKRKDYLSLRTGQTIELPLNLLLIFATNLHPNDLLEEAYLRRLPYRILVPNPSPEQYRRIFQRASNQAGLPFDPEALEYLFRRWYEARGIQMRACHPKDILNRILDISRFERLEPTLSPDLVEQAAGLYFAGPLQHPGDSGISANGPPESAPDLLPALARR